MERDHLYRDYITIVFGLIATKGLEQISDKALHHELWWSQAPFFLGAFIVGIHYWYVCVNFAGISSTTHAVLSKGSAKKFWNNVSNIIFFGMPVLFVSAYAGAVVTFFYAIPGRYDLLFRAFGVLLLVSWVNDLWDIAVAAYAKSKTNVENEKGQIEDQRKLSRLWLACDLPYFVGFAFAYHWIVSMAGSNPVAAGAAFIGLIALGVGIDAAVTPLEKKTENHETTVVAAAPGVKR